MSKKWKKKKVQLPAWEMTAVAWPGVLLLCCGIFAKHSADTEESKRKGEERGGKERKTTHVSTIST